MLLNSGNLFQRHLHAEIAARHHQGIRKIKDLVETGYGLRLLDFCHHHGAAARDLLGLGDVVGALDEGERDPINARVKSRFEIGSVLGGERSKPYRAVGQTDTLAVRELAANFDTRDDVILIDLGRGQFYFAVVEEQVVSRLDGREYLGMRQVHARGVARRRISIEDEYFAFSKRDRARLEHSDP